MTPEQIVNLVKYGSFAIVPIIFVAYSIRRMRDERFDSRCMGAFALASISGVILLLGIPMSGSARALWALGALGGSMVAPIVALIGLVLRPSGTRGVGYAIFAILFSVIVFLGSMALLVRTGMNLKKDEEKKAETLEFEEFNFAFDFPAGYVSMEPKKINPDASLAAMRSKPQVFFMLIAESNPGDLVTTETAAEIADGMMRATSPKILDQKEGPGSVAGIDGIERVTTLVRAGKRLRIIQWFGVDRGSLYQTMTWASTGLTETRLRGEHRKLTAGFSILDPTLVTETETAALVEEYASEYFPYSVNFGTDAWRHWSEEDHREDATDADLAARFKSSNFTVYAVSLQGIEPPLPVLSDAMQVAFMNHDPPNEPLLIDERTTVDDRAARHVRFIRDYENTKFWMNAVTIRVDDTAYFVSEWVQHVVGKEVDWVDLTNVLEFSPATPKKPLSAPLRLGQVNFWRTLGDQYRDRKDYTSAADA